MRFAPSTALLALGLLATSARATYWCYSTETSCRSQLTDCALDAGTGHYCGNVANKPRRAARAPAPAPAPARSRSIWCYSSEALCQSELDDCAYDPATGEYCGTINQPS